VHASELKRTVASTHLSVASDRSTGPNHHHHQPPPSIPWRLWRSSDLATLELSLIAALFGPARCNQVSDTGEWQAVGGQAT
jgi:hypothetical protein